MRKFIAAIGAAALAVGLALIAPTSPASALSPGLSFSAADLPTWQANGEVWALASVHGKVVAGGSFTQLSPPTGGSGSPQTHNAIAVLDADTGSPASCQFTMAMAGGSPVVYAATAAPDGNSIYVGGNFSSINGTTVLRLAQLDPVACTVKSLRVTSISSVVRSIAVSPDESTVYFGGDFTSVDGQPRGHFASVSASTGALLPWIADAEGTDPTQGSNDPDALSVEGRGIAVSPDGTKVAVGGHFYTVNGADSHGLAVVDASSGVNLMAYPDGFIPHTSVIQVVVSDGDAFYAGAEGTGGGVFDGSFKIDWASLQQVWRDTCLGATQAILPYKGTLYEASHHHDCSSMNEYPDGKRYYFTANSEDDSHLLGWFPTANDGIGEHIGPRALAAATGATTGKAYLWAGGEFTLINGKAQQGLTRFTTDDTTVPPIPVPVAQGMSNGSIQVRFRTVVDPDDSNLTYAVYRDGGSTPVWTGTAQSMWWERPQVTFVDTNAAAGSTHNYRVTASDGTNTSAKSALTSATAVAAHTDYASQVITDGANLYWRYDETSGTWLQDKSGATTNGLNGLYAQGVVGGAAGAIPGDPSTAATFDGSTQYAWSDQLAPAPTTYSIETWIKTSTTSGGMIMGYGNGRPNTGTGATNLSNNYDRHLYMENSGRLDFGVWTGGAQIVRSSAAYNDNQWHYIVASQGPSGIAMYVDGVRVGTNPTTTAQSYWGTWRVGGDNLGGWPNQPGSNFFAGTIDETAVYPAPLTAQQVANHYTLGGGTPNVNHPPADAYGAAVFNDSPDLYWRLGETSGTTAADSSYFGQNPGVYGNRVQLGQTGISGSAIGVRGAANSTVGEAQSVPSPSSFSGELWFKTNTVAGGKLLGFEDTQSGNGSSYDKQLYMAGDGSLIFGVYNGQIDTLQSNPGYNDNAWHHVVVSQDSSGMKLYIDGALITSNSVTTNQSYTGYWRIGGGNLNGWPQQPLNSYFTGLLDEVAVYPTALSASDVASHYALGVHDTQAPTAPTNVTAALAGSSVQVAWNASSDNIAVVGYSVYRGSSADFVVGASSKVADVSGTTWQDDSPPVGTSYYKVVAIDGAGNTSAPSDPASVTVSDVVAPSAPSGLSATPSGTSVGLSWSASTDNVGVTGYTVYRGSSSDFSVGTGSKIADVTGTSYTDSGLAVGTYYYKVTAADAAGNVSAPSDAAFADVQPAQQVTLTASPSDDAMVFQSNPTTNYGSNTQLSVNGGSNTVQSFLKFAIPAAPAGTYLSGATLGVRTSTDPTAGSTSTQNINLVTGAWDQSTVTWNNRPTALGAQLGAINAATATNTPYMVNLSAASLSAGSTVSFVLTSSGSDNLRLWSSESSTPSYRPLLTLVFSPGAPPTDTTPPSVPSGVAANASDTSIAVTWSASSDNVGVTGYSVYRGSTAGFTADASSKIADLPGTSYNDTGLAAGTYYYKVTARDAAGNVSAASGAASATIAPPVQPPTVVTLNPTDDAMVYQSNPTTNYGTNTQLSANGGTNTVQSFLKFALPAAPAGTALTSATLRVRTSTDATAGSADPHAFRTATGDWSQSSVTWNTRPTSLGGTVGTLSGATATNTEYTVTLDAAQVAALLGGSATFALVADTGNVDNVRLWSDESATSSYRPLLTLTYTPQ
ncbi:MAG TPA: DNRLRE domain-containing protein [Humibacter sp.]|nr:DNRLRE domain-containing protein [Humibacter sp.]